MAKKGAPGIGEKLADGKRERDAHGRFAPGHKSNGGRPKVPEEIREAFQKVCPEALEVLVSIMSDAGAKDTDRIRAAEVILERGYGKAPQSIDLTTPGSVLVQLSDEAMRNGG